MILLEIERIKIELVEFAFNDLSKYDLFFSLHQTRFGNLLIASNQVGICYLSFIEETQNALSLLKESFGAISFRPKNKEMHQKVAGIFQQLKVHIPSLVLHINGSEFQLKVWKSLIDIPFGQTVSYMDVANIIGQPLASRAVGNAIAKNNIAFFIPCHRVIKGDGLVGNYRWGRNRKEMLLKWEKDCLKE